MGLCNLIFGRLIPLFVVLAAIFIGFLMQADVPLGRLFAIIFPLTKGQLPPCIVGHGKMKGTPPVPDDMVPEPRPKKEMFVELPDGYKMPQAGIGMCCRPSAYDDVLVERSVLWYLLMGGRHIDGAHLYLNHRAIGKGIKEAIRRGVPREEIFVTTKIWPTFYGYNKTMETVPTWLDELGLEYLDLVLMHMPSIIPGGHFMSFDCEGAGLSKSDCRKETFRALSQLREQGVMRNVGVSNFADNQIKELLEVEGGAPIANNQIQFNPWLSDNWMRTVEFCKMNGIAVTGYNTLGGSLQQHETSTVEVLSNLATKYEKSIAQIMLRWAVQKGTIVIPGTGNPKHMRENLDVYSFALRQEDVLAIDALRTTEEMKKFMMVETDVYE